MIHFGRDICGNYEAASRKEWLVTNGIGGYASGTIASSLTRSYHGLLVAACQPPVGRMLLLTKLDETAELHGEKYPLFTNHWGNGSIEPGGHRFIESFHLEGTCPVWSYALADACLEKIIWMQPGENKTYIQYRYQRGRAALHLRLRLLLNYRDHHGTNQPVSALQISAVQSKDDLLVHLKNKHTTQELHIATPGAVYHPLNEWAWDFYLAVEASRGERPIDDHFILGEYTLSLNPGQQFTLAAADKPVAIVDGVENWNQRRSYEDRLAAPAPPSAPGWIRQLYLAADQFIVQRSTPQEPHGASVIAGYPWFTDWGRDTMISLPGLALVTGRLEDARRILTTFAAYLDRGMLPNRFPDPAQSLESSAPEYNTVDATLWYFEALRAYQAASGDLATLLALYPALLDIIDWHQRGTRYHIQVDPQDGLLYAGEAGVQLTWMDAMVGDWVVTPRTGKPVEINALWYHALCCMAEFARLLGKNGQLLRKAASQAKKGFQRFWNPDLSCCYDVLDTPDGDDASLRPNQLLAVSLAHSPLNRSQQRQVVDTCARELLISYGLRSLSPKDPAYLGIYGGPRRRRDATYHQGTAWGWLLGPFISAHLRVYGDPKTASSFLQPIADQLSDHGLGSLSEIFDGSPPHTARGCIAQAWSVAEILRAWKEVDDRNRQQDTTHRSTRSP